MNKCSHRKEYFWLKKSVDVGLGVKCVLLRFHDFVVNVIELISPNISQIYWIKVCFVLADN